MVALVRQVGREGDAEAVSKPRQDWRPGAYPAKVQAAGVLQPVQKLVLPGEEVGHDRRGGHPVHDRRIRQSSIEAGQNLTRAPHCICHRERRSSRVKVRKVAPEIVARL